MGCDGGTIPKRNEIVKNKQNQSNERSKASDLAAKWQFCSLSSLPLRKPIVACQLGRMYNKDALIEYLLEQKNSSKSNNSKCSSSVSHIRTLRDVKELKLKNKTEAGKNQAPTSSDQVDAQFVCPISGLELNGKYKFYYIFSCGCVISDRALKKVPNDGKCILCSTSYEPTKDLIVINGDSDEVEKLKLKLLERKQKQKATKRGEASVPGWSDGGVAKKLKPDSGSKRS